MQRRQFISLVGCAALAPFAALPASAEGCADPVAQDDGWPLASADDSKLIDRDALCRMADGLTASGANIHAVVVARGGISLAASVDPHGEEARKRRREP
jgi:hypothetical protein